MKNRRIIIISLIILVALMFCIPYMGIQAASEDDFEIEDGILIKYNGASDSPEIPAEVNAIGPDAFMGADIKEITIPASVVSIGETAFYDCDKLSSVTIKQGVKKIGNSAFADCDVLSSINIPDSVIDIGLGVFAADDSLVSISTSGNSNYFFNDGALYNKDSTELIQYLSSSKSRVYEMPFSVKKIYKYAFWGAKYLEYVRVSNNVSVIPAYAFSGCSSLKAIFVPESIKRIDDYAFYNCSSLSYMALEKSSTKVSPTALNGCGKVTTDNGISADAANSIISDMQKKDEKERESEQTAKTPKEELSGAVGVIHGGEVTILDVIEHDKDDNYKDLDGEIGSAKTSNGSVNVFIDEINQPIGTITLDRAPEREKQRIAAQKEAERLEKQRQEEEALALKKALDDKRKQAFNNWKNK